MAQVSPKEESFFEPLSKLFLEIEAKGLKVKDASYQNKRIEYCKGL